MSARPIPTLLFEHFTEAYSWILLYRCYLEPRTSREVNSNATTEEHNSESTTRPQFGNEFTASNDDGKINLKAHTSIDIDANKSHWNQIFCHVQINIVPLSISSRLDSSPSMELKRSVSRVRNETRVRYSKI
jgi:hypothetical protein